MNLWKEKKYRIRMIPYLADMMSKSILNQWFHDQQLTLTKDHLLAVHLRPKTNILIMFNMQEINTPIQW